MNVTERLLGPDADLAILMRELFVRLPDADEPDDAVDPEMWERALIGPARDILSRSGKGLRARLVERCYRLAGGGNECHPETLPVLIELLHVGSLIIDDIEDDSDMRRGQPALHVRYGVPLALNTGNWFYFFPLVLLSRLELPEAVRLAIYEDTSLALLHCHQGQALDLSVQTATVPQRRLPALVARATRLKTGALMELAALIGARSAGASREWVEAFARFGADLGVGLQMLDDWSGIRQKKRRDKGLEDIQLGRLTWPWAWLATNCDHVSYAALMSDLQEVSKNGGGDRIIERLRSDLATTAPARIRDHLEQTLSSLSQTVGPSEELDSLCDFVAELEKAYG